jgi:hypothetical protein
MFDWKVNNVQSLGANFTSTKLVLSQEAIKFEHGLVTNHHDLPKAIVRSFLSLTPKRENRNQLRKKSPTSKHHKLACQYSIKKKER